MSKKEELIQLYAKNSKHSNYQILSRRLSAIIGSGEIEVKTRYESERLKYILDNTEIKNKSVLDIGGNSGYFSFELLDNGASHVHYYEGNPVHSEFVKLAAETLGVAEKVEVTNRYMMFKDELNNTNFDIILLLNVLHHLGDDFGDTAISMNNARKEIITHLRNLAGKTQIMIFQLGFNWKGNRNMCLCQNGRKAELISYLKEGLEPYWEFIKIGIAENVDGTIVYKDLNDKNIHRVDSLGEFLNRPIFILKSKVV